MKKVVWVALILILGACSSKQPGTDPAFVIYPYDFYEKFNLRTIISSYRNHLHYYCTRYPKDFFKENEIRTANNKLLILDNGNKTLTFEMVAYNKVIITDLDRQNKYKSKSLYTFFYNKEADDFRVYEFFIKQKDNCKEYKKGHFKVDTSKIIIKNSSVKPLPSQP